MHRKRSFRVALAASSLAALGLLLTVVGPAAGRVGSHGATKVTVVTVTVGKPTELAFKLSKFSMLPAGTITFNVTNQGLGFHNFKICTSPVTSLAKNACVGQVTKLLHHGDKATLTVKLTKSGKYEYLCAVTGHAAAGMKGLIGVGVPLTASAATVAASPKSTGSSSSTSGSTSSGGTTSGGTTSGGTTSGGTAGGGGGGGGGGVSECPGGAVIGQNGVVDDDPDDNGQAPSDLDGCI
jgi:uncharacterized cupredoxin-like copper-binding protein